MHVRRVVVGGEPCCRRGSARRKSCALHDFPTSQAISRRASSVRHTLVQSGPFPTRREENRLDDIDAIGRPDDGAKKPDGVAEALFWVVESALKAQAAPAASYVRGLRAKNPRLTPIGLVRKLDRQLLAAATSSGIAAGASAAAPGVGKTFTAAITIGSPAVSAQAAVFYILAMAEVHQIPAIDIEHRRKLALCVILGAGAETALPKFTLRTSRHWTRKTLKAIPGSALKPINNAFHQHFITKEGKTGTIVLAAVLPYVLGGRNRWSVRLRDHIGRYRHDEACLWTLEADVRRRK